MESVEQCGGGIATGTDCGPIGFLLSTITRGKCSSVSCADIREHFLDGPNQPDFESEELLDNKKET